MSKNTTKASGELAKQAAAAMAAPIPLLKAASLDLRPLYYFVQVADSGSFSRAAATLSVSQPILSRFIRRLEDDLQVQLLHRDGRGVRPTNAGLQLLESGKTILSGLSKAEIEVAALRESSLGTVSVGLLPLLGSELTVELIRRLRRDYPLISIVLREGFAAETLEWLSSGAVDIGVLYNPPSIATLILDHVLDDRLHLVGGPNCTDFLAGAECPARKFGELPLILPPQPHRLRAIVDEAGRKAGVQIRSEVDVTGISTILELLRAGVGYTVLPFTLVRSEVEARTLRSWPIVDPIVAPKLYIATSMQRPQTKATKVVLEMISDLLRKRKGRR